MTPSTKGGSPETNQVRETRDRVEAIMQAVSTLEALTSMSERVPLLQK